MGTDARCRGEGIAGGGGLGKEFAERHGRKDLIRSSPPRGGDESGGVKVTRLKQCEGYIRGVDHIGSRPHAREEPGGVKVKGLKKRQGGTNNEYSLPPSRGVEHSSRSSSPHPSTNPFPCALVFCRPLTTNPRSEVVVTAKGGSVHGEF